MSEMLVNYNNCKHCGVKIPKDKEYCSTCSNNSSEKKPPAKMGTPEWWEERSKKYKEKTLDDEGFIFSKFFLALLVGFAFNGLAFLILIIVALLSDEKQKEVLYGIATGVIIFTFFLLILM